MTRHCCLVWQALLVSCLLRSAESASTIQRDNEKEVCAEFVCTRHSLKTETRTFVEDVQTNDGRQIECKSCEHCTSSGFSYCLKPKNDERQCLCAQELPRGCNISPRTAFKPVPEQQQMNICYSSSLRNPPKPTATNEPKNNDLILTIDQFWLKNYWKHMKLENLTLFYEFPINSPHLCDGLITTVNRQRAGEDTGYLCTPSLKIELEEEPIDSRENSDGSISNDDYDNNLPPEIQFERAVFDGAPYVRFFYRIQVRRERQLNAQNMLVERLTTLTSDILTYDLDQNNVKTTPPQTRVFKTTTTKGLPPSREPSTTTPAISKVNIEQRQNAERKESAKPSDKQSGQGKDSATHKSGSFLDEHLNNGGQLQLVVCVTVITLGVCLLLIVGTLLYRRHIGNAKNQSAKMPATKQMNGFEYRATVQDER